MQHKPWISVISFGLILALLAGCCFIKPPTLYSATERRPLASAPSFTLSAFLSGDFAEDSEKYVTDHFPFRDAFRRLQGFLSEKILGVSDHNGLYSYNGSVADMNYPLNTASIEHACDAFTRVYDTYLQDADVYISVIPDKNAYTAAPSGHLSIDYDTLYTMVQTQTSYARYIPIDNLLSADMYYCTDLHWNQQYLPAVAQALANAMKTDIPQEYRYNTAQTPFYGVYAGQYPLPIEPDTLTYLTNSTIESMTVFDYESNEKIPLYDHEALAGKDPYSFFAGGSKSLITIENPSSKTEKELIVFRDSFASPIAPLLAQGYRTTTLVDIRYISPTQLQNYLDFSDQDVLFLYSASVLNDSGTIK